LKLEDMSGLEVMREIKTNIPGTECILLTGHASQNSAIEAVNLGAYGYMQKPYAVEHLLLMIQRAIEKRETELALQRVAEQRRRLLQVAQSMLATLAVDEIVDQIQLNLKEILAYDGFGLYALDEENATVHPVITAGDERVGLDLKPAGQSILRRVAQSGQPVMVNNAHQEPQLMHLEEVCVQGEHILALPIKIQGKTWGVFLIRRLADQLFSVEEFELMQLFNSYVSLALENAYLFEQTQLSKKRYHTLFEKSKDAIVTTNADGKIIDANPAAVELLDFTSQTELVQSDSSQPLYYPTGDEATLRQILKRQGFAKDVEIIVQRRDKQSLTILTTITAVQDEKGDITGYQAIGRDITERLQLEAQLRQSQKMEAIGRLAGGVAHDFNNLLTVIMGYTGLLLASPDMSAVNGQSALQGIDQAAQQAAGLTRQLLAFSRLQVMQPRILDLNEIVSNVERMLRRLIGEDIDLITVLSNPLGKVRVDPGQVEQVIVNLAVNARDAMPQGGKLIKIKVKAPG
jgi:PAS domain S-box-containing protein